MYQTTLTVDEIKRRYLDLPPTWTCPITGLVVPMRHLENLQYRQQIIEEAEHDELFRNQIYTAASKSLIWWINTFVWTLRTKIVEPDGTTRQVKPDEAHQPFVLWPIQIEHILELEKSINDGYDLMTDKSRDMGATWGHLALYYHKWLFENSRSFLLLSAKEDYVDSPGAKGPDKPADPSTLFGKLDYIGYWLPKWMRPPQVRIKLHLVNLANNSRIDGESTTATAGSSERRTVIFLDEASKMPEAESIKRSTRDVTACRHVNSTPNGAGTTFSKWRFSGAIKVFTLPWIYHPEKARGLYAVKDEVTGQIKLHSPWYDIEEKIRSPKELAIEVDINHIGSGETFFEKSTLLRCMQTWVKPPILRGYHISFKPDVPLIQIPDAVKRNILDTVQVRRLPDGPWSFWFNLLDGRPDQTVNYIFACDIGKGMGASNSIISVGCRETRKKIAEWASAQYQPHEFAWIVAASAIWFGGANKGRRPLIIWEANGDPGIYFGRALIKNLRYPHLWFDKTAATKLREGKPRTYGWHSNDVKKAEVLGDYRRALHQGTFENPSEMALTEAETYIEFGNGQIGPAYLQTENASARKTHGDRVIADALLNYALGLPRMPTVPEMKPPVGSFGYRYNKWREQEQDSKADRVFDFRFVG